VQCEVPIKGGEHTDIGLHRHRERGHNKEQLLEDSLTGGLLSNSLAHSNEFVSKPFPIISVVIL